MLHAPLSLFWRQRAQCRGKIGDFAAQDLSSNPASGGRPCRVHFAGSLVPAPAVPCVMCQGCGGGGVRHRVECPMSTLFLAQAKSPRNGALGDKGYLQLGKPWRKNTGQMWRSGCIIATHPRVSVLLQRAASTIGTDTSLRLGASSFLYAPQGRLLPD